MPTSTYEPISTTTLGAGQNSITIGTGATIPQTYTDLILVANFGMVSAGDIAYIQVGNSSIDTGNNYSYTTLEGGGSGTGSSSRTSNRNTGFAGYSNFSNAWVNSISHFQNYSNSTTNKTWLCRADEAQTLTGAYVNLWRNTSSIKIIKVYTATAGNFTSGSTFTLYGIKAA